MRLHSTTLSGSLIVSQSGARIDAGGFSGSFSGSFSGDGSGLTSIDGSFGSTTRATLSASFMDVAGAAVSGTFARQAAVSASFIDGTATGTFVSGSATSTGSFGHVVVGGHLISTSSGSYDLGSEDKPWRDLHIITSSIKLYSGDGEIGRLQLGTNNELEFFDVSSLTPVQRKTFTPAQIRSNATRKNFRGAQGGNPNAKIRIGITGNQEIDTSSGNLILDSAGGDVAVDDNLKVSGSISVLSGSLTFRGTAAEVDKVSGSAYSTASFGRVENAVVDPSGLPTGTVSSSAQIATDVSGSSGNKATPGFAIAMSVAL